MLKIGSTSPLLVFLLLVVASADASVINKFRLEPSKRHALIIDSSLYPVSLTSPDAALLITNAKNIKRTTIIDYTKKEAEIILYYSDPLFRAMSVNIDSTIPGMILSSYLFLELNDYIRFVNTGQDASEFLSQSPFFSMVEKQRKSFNPLDIEIPLKLPAWAKRFVGSEGPRIQITGSIRLSAGGNSHWTKGAQDPSMTNEGFPSISIKNDMQFTVKGKIGRLLDVNISMSNQESNFDIGDQIKRQLKLHYKGETPEELEDEILQEVEAGYTGFSMQGEEFSGYSVSGNDGLFGIKARLKLGDLNIVAVAAQENSRPENKTYKPGKSETTTKRTEKEIAYDKMFFLDTLFRNAYYNTKGSSNTRILRRVYLFKLDKTITDINNMGNYPEHRMIGDGPHKILRQEQNQYGSSDFYVDQSNKGFVVLSSPLSSSSDQLLAWFEFSENGIDKTSEDLGLFYHHNNQSVPESLTVDNITIRPYVLRPINMDSNSDQWELMCKHIYDIGSVDPNGRNDVTLVISYKDPNTQQYFNTVENGGSQTELVSLFGLTDNAGVLKTGDKNIFLFDYNALILPPDLGEQPFNSASLPGALPKNSGIYSYRTEDHDAKEVKDFYRIEMKARTAATTFSLGVMDIVENSEVIKIGSVTLEKDVDYIIMYDIGQITLISERATNSLNDIDVEYQYSPYFNIDERTFIGLRADYQLENIGKGSRISASFLRKAETGQDKRAQLGREPTSNMLIDGFASLSWEPAWMTSFINLIPGVRTDQKSKLSIQGEVARSIVNTNTSDRDEAIIDDFEDSKTLYPVTLSDVAWRWASPPDTSIVGWAAAMQCWGGNGRGAGALTDCGWFAWYSPPGIKENDIWPGSADLQSTSTVLELTMVPYSKKEGAAEGGASQSFREASWGGAMAALGVGVRDQLENSQYLEIWLKPVSGHRGRLHIDIGELSEDLRIGPQPPGLNTDTTSYVLWNSAPDGKFNTEFFISGDVSVSERNDIGLDMRRDAFEKFLMPVETSTPMPFPFIFDTIGIEHATDPGGDNYAYSENSADYRAFNGTQSNSTGINYSKRKLSADTEDLFSLNGIVDRRNSYHHYWINLSADTVLHEPYFVAQNSKGWRLYRIPLHSRKIMGNALLDSIPYKINNPILSKSQGIRLWMNNISGKSILQVAKIEIVGNRWISKDTTRDTTASKLNVSVSNTVDNPDYKRPPSSMVPIFLDNSSRTREREQSIDMRYTNLSYAAREVKAVRFYSRGMDFRLYQNVSLLCYPIDKLTTNGGNDGNRVFFFLRFGTDSLNYYEYRTKTVATNQWSELKVKLSDLSSLKEDKIKELAGARVALYAESDSTKVVGYPTFADIKWLATGFYVDTTATISTGEKFYGRYYVNDLKLTEPQQLGGNAAKMKLSADFADFLSFNSGAYYKDGSFLKLNEKQANGGASEVSLDASASLSLNRLLPASWGISIPLSLSISNSIQRPRYVPGSDIYLSDDKADEILPDLYRKIVGRSTYTGQDSKSEEYQTIKQQKTLSTSFKKGSESGNIFANLLVDRISVNAAWSETESVEPTRKENSTNITSTFTYSASPRTEKNIEPFTSLKDGFLKEHFGDFKLSWYPRSLDFTIYNTQYSRSQESTRPIPSAELVTIPQKFTLTMSHAFNLNYSGLIDWKHLKLDFSHSNSIDRNFNTYLATNGGVGDPDKFINSNVLKYDTTWTLGDNKSNFILNGETRNTQSFNYTFNPSLFSWLTHRMNYSSNYGSSVNQGKKDTTNYRYLDISSGTSMSADMEWQFLDMFDKFNTALLKNRGDAFFKPTKTFLDKLGFSRVAFNYSVNSKDQKVSGLKSIPLSRFDYLLYKAGFYGVSLTDIFTGKRDADAFGGWKYPSNSRNRSEAYADTTRISQTDGRSVDISGSTNASFNIPLPIRLNLNFSTSFGKSWAELVERKTVDTTYSYPNFTLSGSANDAILLFKHLPLIGEMIQSANLNSSYQYEKSLTRKFDRVRSDVIPWGEYSFKYNFSPLCKVSLEMKNKLRFSNEYHYSLNRSHRTERIPSVKAREATRWSNKASINYSFAKQQPIKILLWEIAFDNQLSINLDWEMGADREYEWDAIQDNIVYEKYEEYHKAKNTDLLDHKSRNLNSSFTAGATYKVSAKVDAGGSASWKKDTRVLTSNKDDDEKNHPEYTIVVEVFVKWVF